MSSKLIRRFPSLTRRTFSTGSSSVSNSRTEQLKAWRTTRGATGKEGSSGPSAAPLDARNPNTPYPQEKVELTPEIHRNNAILAFGLLLFCGCVVQYSLHVVGQPGPMSDKQEDPLVALQREAEGAQAKKLRESQEMADTEEMMKQVNSGAYDPDRYEEDEEDANPRKPWWKFW